MTFTNGRTFSQLHSGCRIRFAHYTGELVQMVMSISIRKVDRPSLTCLPTPLAHQVDQVLQAHITSTAIDVGVGRHIRHMFPSIVIELLPVLRNVEPHHHLSY